MRFVAALVPFLMLAACERGPSAPFAGHAQQPPENITYTGPNGETVTAPGNHGMRFRFEESADSSVTKTERAASGKGTGATSSSAELLSKINASAPQSSLGGITSTGGSTVLEQVMKGGPATAGLALAAVLIALGGIPVLIWVNKRAGLAMFGLAGVLLVASAMPEWAWAVIGIGGVVGLALYLWSEHKGTRYKEALRGVAAGVEDLDDTTRRMAKAKIAAHMDERDKATLRNDIKKADGLPPERP